MPPIGIEAIAKQLGLLDTEAVFVANYVEDMNAARAYRAAHPTCTVATSQTEGPKSLGKPHVAAAVQRMRSAQLARLQLSSDDVLGRLFAIATADPRELVRTQVGACRHCHGEGHLHQYTDGEYAAEMAKADRLGEVFDPKGGEGYSFALPPVDDCPHCAGVGDTRVVMADTSKVSPAAAALYAGAKLTKNGMEVQMHDQLAAVEKLAKHLGLYAADNQQKGASMGEWLAAMNGGAAPGRSALPVVADTKEAGE